MTATANIERKVILIAGACRGSGPATARQLARDGHHVVLGSRRPHTVHALMREIRAAGGSAEWYALDASQPDGMRDFLAFAQDVHKRIDMVINN